MASNFDALRLAWLLEHEANEHGKTDYKHKAAAELRRQHSRIEADEALMRQALDVFEEGRDALQERANRYHDEMRGYYPDEHKAMDQDVVRADAAITALRKRLESSK